MAAQGRGPTNQRKFHYKYFLRARISPWIGAGEERSQKIVHVGVGTGEREETTYLRGAGSWYRAVTTSNYASYIPVKLPRSQGGQNSARSMETRRSLWFDSGAYFRTWPDRSSKSRMVIRIRHTFSSMDAQHYSYILHHVPKSIACPWIIHKILSLSLIKKHKGY